MKKGVNDILTRLQDEAKAQGIRKPQPTPPPPASPAQKQYEEPVAEELSDEEIEYMERMERLMAEQDRLRMEEEPSGMDEPDFKEDSKDGVDKMKITFDENPLRETVVREYPAPKVEETFIQGGEIIDEPTRTNDVAPSQPSDTNETEQ
jgi:hypothetical protein